MNQNEEIEMLKRKMEFQNQDDIKYDQISTKESNEQGLMEESSLMEQGAEYIRNKRPARLLPLQLLYGERKNETDEIPRFYGPPTNCTELSQLGYTLNGYYLVKNFNDSDQNAAVNLDTVYCAFKQPPFTYSPSKLEKRIVLKGKLVEVVYLTGGTVYLMVLRFISTSRVRVEQVKKKMGETILGYNLKKRF